MNATRAFPRDQDLSADRRKFLSCGLRPREEETGSQVRTYLNFMGETDEAFNFYRDVFASEFVVAVQRFSDMASAPGMPGLAEEELNKVMHVGWQSSAAR